MKQYIYVIFSSTPYRIGRFIRKLTGEKYNHVSIALDPELSQMYGFARRYYRTPFYGGFVRESLSRYHVNGQSSQVCICRLPVSGEQYERLKLLLGTMHARQERYLYNHLSVATAVLRKPVAVRDAYTCVEFCVRILSELGVGLDPKRYYTIGQVEQLLRPYAFYVGAMPADSGFDHSFFADKPVPSPAAATLRSLLGLLPRIGS